MSEPTPDGGLSTSIAFEHERRSVLDIGGCVVTVHEPLTAPRGRIIVVPGWSGPRSGPADILVFLANALCADGWRVLRLDIPARGDTPGERNDSGLDEMIAATLAVASGEGSESEPTIFLGMCSGGNVALGAVTLALEAEDSPATLRNAGVIALSTLPFQPSRSKTIERRRMWKNIKQYAGKAASPQTWLRLIKGDINLGRVTKNVTASEKPASGDRNLKDSERDIEKALASWKGNGLFVWGGGDDEGALARAHFENLHKTGMGGAGSVFHTIDGANHNYYGRAWRADLANRIGAWLKAMR